MGHRMAHILFSSLLLSCFLAQTSGKSQQTALSQFYKQKLVLTDIDTSHFNTTHNLNEAQILSQEGLKESDRIERLPGQPEDVTFKQYGGYVTVDQTSGRALYYYFVETQHSEKTLPLLIWFNGGPGCSSFGYGAMTELGPFRVYSDGKTLYRNNFAWNYAANVLFFETPAGVGFSYSNKTNDTTKGGDKRTASDNYIFLLNWLERFPEYKERDIYLAGESYAGHYVPQLAHTIVQHNVNAKKTIINLKGIIIGNAAIDDETDTKGIYKYIASHALVSDETVNQVLKYCDFSPEAAKKNQSNKCIEADMEVGNEFGHIDIYNIYAPLCFDHNLTDRPKKSSVFNFDPCSDYYVYAYLNRPDVQKALHANVTKIPYDWEPCSDVIKKWEDSPSTAIPLLKELMSIGLRVWIYSGDVDARVPVTSTKLSIKQMKLDIKTSWYPWYLSGEVGGYATVYKNLTFVTVRGAGHEVPSYQPARALSMIMHFVAGTDL